MKYAFLSVIFFLSFLIVSAGWAGNNVVALKYKPAGVTLDECSGSVSMIKFTDSREDKAVGESRKGESFQSDIPVSDWVSKAFYDEMKNGGCQVEFHDKEYEFDTDYTLTGDITELYIKQVSLSKYTASVRIYITVKRGGEKIFGKSFASTREKKTVPSPGVNSKVLTELLQAQMLEMVPEIRKKLSK